MKFVPVVHCPGCGMPYTAAQLGFPFTTGARFTVICGISDNKGKKVGCGCAFDFQVVEVPTLETQPKAGWLNKLRGVKEEIQTGSTLEVRAKVRGA